MGSKTAAAAPALIGPLKSLSYRRHMELHQSDDDLDDDVELIIRAEYEEEDEDEDLDKAGSDLDQDLEFLESYVSGKNVAGIRYPMSDFGGGEGVFQDSSKAASKGTAGGGGGGGGRSRSRSVDAELMSHHFMPHASNAGDVHQLESAFCRDFSCCGLLLDDMHALLQHYEECHVHLEEDCDDDEQREWPSNADDDDDSDSDNDSDNDGTRGSRAADNAQPLMQTVDVAASELLFAADVAHPLEAVDAILDGMSAEERNSIYADALNNAPRHQQYAQQHHNQQPQEPGVDAPHDIFVSAFEDSVVPRSGSKSKRRLPINPLVRRMGDVEDDLGLKVIQDVTAEVDRDGKRLRMMSDVVQAFQPDNVDNPDVHEETEDYRHPHHHHRRLQAQHAESDEDDDDEDDDDASNHDLSADGSSVTSGKSSAKPSSSAAKKPREGPMFFDDNGQRIEKPYKCTYPNCDKAYKNANGLKYHNSHGHCGGDQEELDFAARLQKPYVCDYAQCFKRYKNLNGLKYHVEKSHDVPKQEANRQATAIVKRTNAEYGINARSVPSHILYNAMKRKEERMLQGLPDDTAELLQQDMIRTQGGAGGNANSSGGGSGGGGASKKSASPKGAGARRQSKSSPKPRPAEHPKADAQTEQSPMTPKQQQQKQQQQQPPIQDQKQPAAATAVSMLPQIDQQALFIKSLLSVAQRSKQAAQVTSMATPPLTPQLPSRAMGAGDADAQSAAATATAGKAIPQLAAASPTPIASPQLNQYAAAALAAAAANPAYMSALQASMKTFKMQAMMLQQQRNARKQQQQPPPPSPASATSTITTATNTTTTTTADASNDKKEAA